MNTAEVMISLFVALVVIGSYFGIMIPWCRTLRKTMQYVPHEKAIFPSAFIWLFLVPFFGIVFQWLMLPFGIPHGLKNTLSNNSAAVHDANKLKVLGIALQILISARIIIYFILPHHDQPPFPAPTTLVVALSILFFVSISVLWITYWVKIVNFRKTYFENSAYPKTSEKNIIHSEKSALKRPLLLTAYLTLITTGSVYSFCLYAYLSFFSFMTQSTPFWMNDSPYSPSWIAALILAAISIFELIASILLWNWKKIGFYIGIPFAIAFVALNDLISSGLASISSIVFLNGLLIIGLGILYWIVKPVWSNFK